MKVHSNTQLLSGMSIHSAWKMAEGPGPMQKTSTKLQNACERTLYLTCGKRVQKQSWVKDTCRWKQYRSCKSTRAMHAGTIRSPTSHFGLQLQREEGATLMSPQECNVDVLGCAQPWETLPLHLVSRWGFFFRQHEHRMHWEGDDTQTHNKYIQARNKQVQPYNNYATKKYQVRNKHVTNIIEVLYRKPK